MGKGFSLQKRSVLSESLSSEILHCREDFLVGTRSTASVLLPKYYGRGGTRPYQLSWLVSGQWCRLDKLLAAVCLPGIHGEIEPLEAIFGGVFLL